MHNGNFSSCKRERKVRVEKGSKREREGKQREDERKNFFRPLMCNGARGRERDFSSLSPSFILTSDVHTMKQ